MSPYAIAITMHYFRNVAPYPYESFTAANTHHLELTRHQRQAVEELKAAGLLEEHGNSPVGLPDYRLTTRGIAYGRALQAVPVPT